MYQMTFHWRFLLSLVLLLGAAPLIADEEPEYPDLRVGEDKTVVLTPGIHEYNIVYALWGGEIILTGDTEIIVHGEDYPVDAGEYGIISFAAFYTGCNILGEGEHGPYRDIYSPDRTPLPGGDGHDLTIRVLNGSAWTAGMKLRGGDGGRGAISYPGGQGGNFSLYAKVGADLGDIRVNGGDARDSSSNGAAGGQGGNVFIFSEGYLATMDIETYGGDASNGYNDPSPKDGGTGADGGNITLFCVGGFDNENAELDAHGGDGGDGGSAPTGSAHSYTDWSSVPIYNGGNGGNAGDGGTIIIKAGDSFRYVWDSFGGIHTHGGRGGIFGRHSTWYDKDEEVGGDVPGSRDGQPGASGDGADITIISPSISGIDPDSPITYAGGQDRDSRGPPGKDGRLILKEVPARFFPQTSVLEPADTAAVAAKAGENFELVYSFTNDMDVPIEGVSLETWQLNPNCCEPARTEEGTLIQPEPYGQYEVGENRFRAEWPHDIAPGATLEWRFQVHIRDNIPNVGVTLRQRVTIRGEYESEVFPGYNDKGEEYVEYSIPCKQVLDVWVYSEQETAAAGQIVQMTVLCTNNAETTATGVEIELSELPDVLEWEGPLPLPMTITSIPPESSVEKYFSVKVEDPLRNSPPPSFAFDARIRSAELDWSDWQIGKPVPLGTLLLWPETPEGLYITRSNRVPSNGTILGAVKLGLTPQDITALYTTQGRDADTGVMHVRDSTQFVIDGSFFFNEPDAPRVVALMNTLIPVVSGGDVTGEGTHNLEAQSVFYDTVHQIFERSLAHAQGFGMGGGQRQELDTMKQIYPELSNAISVKHTDMAERLHELNFLGAMAMRTARQHFDDLMLGIHGVASVWDLLPIIGNLGSRYIKWGSRGLAGVVGFTSKNKVIKMGLETGIRADGTDYLLKQLPLVGNPVYRFLKKRSIYKGAYKYLVSENDSILEGALKTIYFQLGSGELAETFIRNINHFNQPISEAMTSDLEWDSWDDLTQLRDIRGELFTDENIDYAIKEVLKQGIPLGVEALLKAEHAYGQDRLLSLAFGGSQDAALAAGAIARSKLEHESSSAKGFEDAGEFGREFFDRMTNVLMVAQFIPNKAAQTYARVGSYATDGLSRYSSAGQAWAAGMFIFSVVDIMSLGTESLVEGTLAIQQHSWPDYGLVYTGTSANGDPDPSTHYRMLKSAVPTGPMETIESDPAFMAAYAAIEAAATSRNLDALAEAHEDLSTLIEAALPEESLALSRASLLHGDSLKETSLSMTIAELSQAIGEYANAAGQAIQTRREVLTSTWALALNLQDSASHEHLDACLAAARDAESTIAQTREVLLPVLDLVASPDTPQITMVHYPQSVQVGETFDIQVEVASLAVSSELETVEIELRLPEDGSIESLDPLPAEIQIVDGKGIHTWQVRILEPGYYLDKPYLMLNDPYGEVVDFALLSILAEPAGAEGIITAGSGGTLTSDDTTIQLSVAAGGSTDLQVYLDQLWTLPMEIQGWAPVGDYHLSIQAFDATSEVFIPDPPTQTTVRMRYDPENIPPGHSAGSIKVLYTPDGETWEILPSTVNSGSRTVTAQIFSFGRFATGIPDTDPPLPPSGLSVSSPDGLLDLSWNASPSADVYGYGIRVRVGGGSVHTVGAVRADETTYSMEPLDDLPHQLEVYAYDYAGNPSSERDAFNDDPASNRGRSLVGASVLSILIPVSDHIPPGGRAEYMLDLLNLSDDPVNLSLAAQVPEMMQAELTADSIVLYNRATLGLEIFVGQNAAYGEQVITVELQSQTGNSYTASSVLVVEDWSESNSVGALGSGGSIVSVSGSPSDDLYSPIGLIDGSSLSGWRSASYETGPFTIVIQLADGEVFDVTGFRLDLTPLMPEADPTMAPADVAFLVSSSGLEDDDFSAAGTWNIPAGAVEFEKALGPVEARYIKLVFTANQGSEKYMEVAEVEILGGRRDPPLNFGALRDHLLNRQILPDDKLIQYDLNADGRIDISDLILLLKTY